MFNFFFKSIAIILITFILKPPILDPFMIFAWFLGTIIIVFGDLKRNQSIKNLSFIFLIIILSFSTSFFPKVNIEQASNFVLFENNKNNALKSFLPRQIYNNLKFEFNENYNQSEGRCIGNKKNISGCWKDYKMTDRPFSFSLDSIYETPKYSKIVNEIDFKHVRDIRGGFLNGMKVDFNTNWFEWKSIGDPIREKAPFYILWEFPKKIGGELCVKGKFYTYQSSEKISFYNHDNKKCFDIPIDKNLKVLAFRINSDEKLEVKYNPKNLFLTFNFLKILTSIIICIIFIKSVISIRFKNVTVTCIFCLMAFFLTDIQRDFRAFYEHKFLLLGAGGDALTYWGFARDMMYSFLKGDIIKAFSGSENIFFYMPGHRYFQFFQAFIFGESSILGWFFVLVTPATIFYLLRNFTNSFYSTVITLFFSLFFFINYYRGVHLHAEAVAYPLAFISLNFSIQLLNKNKIDAHNNYIFYASILMAIAIILRPNILLPAFLVHSYLLYKNFTFKSFRSFFIGYLPLLLLPFHNLFYGGKLILITSSSLIPNNMSNSPTNWLLVISDLLEGNYISANVNNFFTYFFKYFSGPAIQPFYLLIPIIIYFLVFRIFKKFKLNPLILIKELYNDKIILILYFLLGNHIVFWFFKADGRYTYMAFILTFCIILLYLFKFFETNTKINSFRFIERFNDFVDNTISKGPYDFKNFLLSCWPLGYFPLASGTICSLFFGLVGFVLNYKYGWQFTLLLAIVLCIFGLSFCYKLNKKTKFSDPNWVVIDEAVGQLLVSSYAGLNPYTHIIGFLLFRFFDISKMSIIKKSEKIPFGIGIMADDILAALSSIIVLSIFSFFIF